MMRREYIQLSLAFRLIPYRTQLCKCITLQLGRVIDTVGGRQFLEVLGRVHLNTEGNDPLVAGVYIGPSSVGTGVSLSPIWQVEHCLKVVHSRVFFNSLGSQPLVGPELRRANSVLWTRSEVWVSLDMD